MYERLPVIQNAPEVSPSFRKIDFQPFFSFVILILSSIAFFARPGITAESTVNTISLAYMVDQSTDIVVANASAVSARERTSHAQNGSALPGNTYRVTISETLKPSYGGKVNGGGPREIDIVLYGEGAHDSRKNGDEKDGRENRQPPVYRTKVVDLGQELRKGVIFFLQKRDGVYYVQNPSGYESLAAINRVKELIKGSEAESDSGCVQN